MSASSSTMSGSSSNSKSNFSSGKNKFYRTVKCKCGIWAACWEAWKPGTQDPGRRFFGCSNYKNPEETCKFFEWAEPAYTERAREVIQEIKYKLEMKYKSRSDEASILRNNLKMVEEKKLFLEGELQNAEKKNKELADLLTHKEKMLAKFKMLLILMLSVVIFLLVFVCNNK
ncbi:hypothetical protein OROMI_009571 [Orobanche minor]